MDKMMIEWPEKPTPALAEVAATWPRGEAIHWAGAMREAGHEIPKHYEEENAAMLHFLIPFALAHPEDWRGRAIAELKRQRDARGAEGQ